MIMEHLFSEENKKKIVAELNKSINIPIINEKTEGKILDSIYDVFEAVLKNALLKSK